jgi:NAD(P)-dependent dehydrogenase (short-subunit alcohol dehydrogenase family)
MSTEAGGGNGIGLVTAKLFLAEQAKVLIVDIDPTKARADAELAEAFKANRLDTFQADVSQEDKAVAYSAYAVKVFGRLDIAVFCAGVCPRPTPWIDTDVAEYDRIMRVNAKGSTSQTAHNSNLYVLNGIASAYFGIKHVAQAIKPFSEKDPSKGGGALVLVSSTAGLRGAPAMR